MRDLVTLVKPQRWDSFLTVVWVQGCRCQSAHRTGSLQSQGVGIAGFARGNGSHCRCMLVGIIPIGLHRGALAEFSFGLTVLVYILVGSCVSVFVVGLRIGIGSPLIKFVSTIEVLQSSPHCKMAVMTSHFGPSGVSDCGSLRRATITDVVQSPVLKTAAISLCTLMPCVSAHLME